MDNADWDSVLQFVSEPLDLNYADKHDDRSLNAGPIQVPTPPESHDGSPVVEDGEPSTLVSVSTTFFPGAHLNSAPPDVALLSSDEVFFYVHSHLLLAASTNGFRTLLPPPSTPNNEDPILRVDEASTVLNIILHTVYDMSCAHYSPSFETLSTAVRHLSLYGIDVKARISPNSPLFALLLSHAPLVPLELYALAASYDIYELAVATSSHLLSFPLSTLADETALQMGPVYLKRLFFLHFGRADALKRVLLPPPNAHTPTPWCDLTEQKKLTRAWALASAYLAWDARPDLSTSAMESALSPLAEHLTCEQCQTTLRERIQNLIVQWSLVKNDLIGILTLTEVPAPLSNPCIAFLIAAAAT